MWNMVVLLELAVIQNHIELNTKHGALYFMKTKVHSDFLLIFL